MSRIMTTWPGQAPPGAQINPLTQMFGQAPMFGTDPGYRYTGPFNTHQLGPVGALMAMGGPFLASGFMGGQYMPAQFFPEQNLYAQMLATQQYNNTMQAMQFASQRDTLAMDQTLGGLRQMISGQPLTPMQQAQNFRMASSISQFMPFLTQMLGPDLVDQLHGSRGSATIFAQQLSTAMRTALDPVTGQIGYSGRSAGVVTNAVFDQLFGPNANPSLLRGMSAGQAGMAVNELQARGLLGQPLGMMSLTEQRSLIPRELSESTLNRIAESLPEIQNIIKAGKTPTADELSTARSRVLETNAALTDSTRTFTKADLEEMPGAQDIISAADADRISSRLKNLAGAVKAMRDIFGDMGKPNAPMRELINGLDALTQGGLATMAPGDIEMLLRRTQAIAKQTGIGIQGLVGLTTQNAALADQLGLDRGFAIQAANQSALFGAASAETGRLDLPMFGSPNKEELTLADAQLRMHAAASPLNNQLSAIMRMVDSGMATPAAGSQLAAIVEAIQAQKPTYEFNGRTHSLVMQQQTLQQQTLQQILARDAGITGAEMRSIMSDRFGNQEYAQKYGTQDLTRSMMGQELVRRSVTPALSNRIRGMLEEDKIDETLLKAGITGDTKDFRRMADNIAAGIGQDFLAMDATTFRTPELRRKAFAKAFRTRMSQEISRLQPGMDPAQVESLTDMLIQQQGGQQALDSTGETMFAVINTAVKANPLLRSSSAAHLLFSDAAVAQAAKRGRAAEGEAIMQSALAGLGTSGPIQRLIDTLQTAGPDTNFQDVLGGLIGGVNYEDIAKNDPTGVIAQVLGLAKSTAAMDFSDPERLAEVRRNARTMRALMDGGESARQELERMNNEGYGNDLLREKLQKAIEKGGGTVLDDLGYVVTAGVSLADVQAVRARGDSLNAAIAAGDIEKSQKKLNAFLTAAGSKGQQLLLDNKSMEQLGRGGLELVKDASAASKLLEEMAADNNVSVYDLLYGDNIDADTQKQAQEILQKSQRSWEEIERRHKLGRLPGVGEGENAIREKMTETERSMLAAEQKFILENQTAEERAKAAMSALDDVLTPAQREELNVDINQQQLQQELTTNDRGHIVYRAATSQKELLELGLRKKVFGDKTRIEQLSEEERKSVMQRLRDAGLSDEEYASALQLESESTLLSGLSDDSEGQVTSDLLERLQTAAPVVEQKEIDEQREVKIRLSGGNITINDDGTADLELEGTGTMNHIFNLLG